MTDVKAKEILKNNFIFLLVARTGNVSISILEELEDL